MNLLRQSLSQNIRVFPLLAPSKLISQRLFKFATAVGSKEYFDGLVSTNKVVIFMKGTPDEPRCGFSNAVVQVLRMHGAQYDAHDVLKDEQIRQGIKEYSEWPTIPQVFLNGEFVGGCDILIQMHQSGELVRELGKIGIKSALLQASEEAQTNEKS